MNSAGSPSIRSRIRHALRAIGAPVTHYFDRRFQDLHDRLSRVDATQATTASLEGVVSSIDELRSSLGAMPLQIAAGTETVAGLARSIDRQLAQHLRQAEAADAVRAVELGLYRPEVVALLNRVLSFDGPIAERHLLINHPLTVFFDLDGPRLFEVNERIVEIPFAMAAAGVLVPGSTVVDVGATESTLALSFASLGHRTFALDPRGYPFTHPNLETVTTTVEQWSPSERVDLVTAISAVEHFGLGHYVDGGHDDGADREALDHFRSWLAPGGRVVLSVPTGRSSTDQFQRVYDEERLAGLCKGWSIEHAEYSVRTSLTTWEPRAYPDPESRGVAMVILS